MEGRFGVQGAGFGVQGARFGVQSAECRVQGAGCRVQGAGCRVQGAGLRALAKEGDSRPSNPVQPFRVSGLGVQVPKGRLKRLCI